MLSYKCFEANALIVQNRCLYVCKWYGLFFHDFIRHTTMLTHMLCLELQQTGNMKCNINGKGHFIQLSKTVSKPNHILEYIL